MEGHELSAQEVQLIGELLIPAVKEALRDEFHKVRKNASEAVASAERRIDIKFDQQNVIISDLGKRTKSLETNQRKALFGYAAIVAVVSLAYSAIMDAIKKKLGLH